jgi:ubiquinone/menaquinone biosynthesis C-methylase UbiE
MKGSWSALSAFAYDLVVTPALVDIYRSRLDRYVELGMVEPGMRVLDAGCGSGRVMALLAERFPGLRLEGVDLSKDMVEKARRVVSSHANVSVRHGDVQSLPFDADTFDGVISLASIKHWPDQGAGLSEIFRVLKPGGRAFVMEADRNCSRPSSARFVATWRLTPWPARFVLVEYFMRFVAGQGLTAERIESLMEGAGFREVKVEVHEDFPAVSASGLKP